VEAHGGFGMVNAVPRKKPTKAAPGSASAFSTSIKLSEVIAGGLRFEAAAFNIEARQAVQAMRVAGHSLVALYGASGLATFANKPTRFPRIYVDADHGTPFLSSSDIISMRPEIENYLSRKLTPQLDELLIREWDVLISRSGTVGNVGLAPERFASWALSEHAIRLRAPTPEDSAFISAFLRSRFGRLQLLRASYGSVVQHIEPEHLQKVLVPDLPMRTRRQVGSSMMKASRARDDANRLLDKADADLHTLLKLPPLSSLYRHKEGPVIVKQHASSLCWRFEASFHDPVAQMAQEISGESRLEVSRLGDSNCHSRNSPHNKISKARLRPEGWHLTAQQQAVDAGRPRRYQAPSKGGPYKRPSGDCLAPEHGHYQPVWNYR